MTNPEKTLLAALWVLAFWLCTGFAHPRPTCQPIDRILIDGQPFTGTWWVEQELGSSVRRVQIQLKQR